MIPLHIEGALSPFLFPGGDLTKIVKFVSDAGTYTFPDTGQTLDTNFKDVLARSSRLPGVDGGVDEYGSGWAPTAIGNISFGFYLVSRTREGMEAKRSEVAKMRGWGTGALFYQPTDPALPMRWAFCRVNRIGDPQRLDANTDLHQLVSMSLHSAQPYWYSYGTERLWDDGGLYDDGGLWDGNASADTPTSITSAGTVTATVGGNVQTMGRLLVVKDSAGVASDPIIRRVVNGRIVDELKWYGNLNNGEFLEINPRAQTVIKVGSNAYSTFERPLHPDWMRLQPGVNTLQCYITGTAKFAARWMERYV